MASLIVGLAPRLLQHRQCEQAGLVQQGSPLLTTGLYGFSAPPRRETLFPEPVGQAKVLWE